jgi:hypothetical protein
MKPPVRQCGEATHHEDPEPEIRAEPGLFGEVHAKHTGDEGNRNKDRSDNCQPLHHAIDLVGDLREIGIEHVRHQIAVAIQRFVDTEQVIGDVSEVRQRGFLDVSILEFASMVTIPSAPSLRFSGLPPH